MEETGIRERKRRKKVRRGELGQALSGGEEKRRGLYWGRAAAQVENPGPRSSAAPCLHCEFHIDRDKQLWI